MEKSHTKKSTLKFEDLIINVGVVRYYDFIRFKSKVLYVLPDSSYGEWIIYEKLEPKYYYKAFDDKGNPDKIAEFSDKNNIDIEKLLEGLFKKVLNKKITTNPFHKMSFLGYEKIIGSKKIKIKKVISDNFEDLANDYLT